MVETPTDEQTADEHASAEVLTALAAFNADQDSDIDLSELSPSEIAALTA